ncbi:hypothetical protein chiPu_0003785 [Chiloscyllium punctatum]|uniref:Uncharacterized protein n=1 Tax=Chiloscyllium punctatum TaxID=137246 RepID=A0A401S4Q6_CHIPU|nr:hypothetical protein [Chiloscyllium punctatum]
MLRSDGLQLKSARRIAAGDIQQPSTKHTPPNEAEYPFGACRFADLSPSEKQLLLLQSHHFTALSLGNKARLQRPEERALAGRRCTASRLQT